MALPKRCQILVLRWLLEVYDDITGCVLPQKDKLEFLLLEAKENRIRKSPPKMLWMIAEIVLQLSFTLQVGSSFDYIRFYLTTYFNLKFLTWNLLYTLVANASPVCQDLRAFSMKGHRRWEYGTQRERAVWPCVQGQSGVVWLSYQGQTAFVWTIKKKWRDGPPSFQARE